MENLDFFTYYPIEDLLVVYTYDEGSLREDTIYGFEQVCQDLDTSSYFWSIDWHGIESIVHRVLVTDYSLEEYKERFKDNEQYFGMNFEEQYTIQEVLDELTRFEMEENMYY